MEKFGPFVGSEGVVVVVVVRGAAVGVRLSRSVRGGTQGRAGRPPAAPGTAAAAAAPKHRAAARQRNLT